MIAFCRQRRPLLAILTAYLLITFTYGLVNPLFEAPDAHYHYFTAQYIADNWQLPSLPPDNYDPFLSQEAAQPPLYYILSAILIAPIDTSQARDHLWFNPRVQLGDASSPTNTNAFVHGNWEAFPWQGYALAAHILRIFSTFIGLGTLCFIYAATRLVWTNHPQRALLATALVAFLPQFNFHHSAITNDVLIIFFCTAGIYQLIHLWHNPLTTTRLILLSLTLGLAILSKTAGILLALYAFIFIIAILYRDKSKIQNPFSKILALILPAILLAGWLLLRNWHLYGDPTAANQFIRIAGGDRGYTLWQVLDETGRAWISLFAMFGWFNLRAPTWVYAIWGGISLLSLLGTLKSLIKKRPFIIHHSSFIILLSLFPLLIYAGIANFMLHTPAAQGRLLFPALIPLVLGLVYGLSQWQWRLLHWLAPALALLTTLYSVAIVISYAYNLPAPLSDLPATVSPLNADLGQGLILKGTTIETPVTHTGNFVYLTLYWQATQPLSNPLSLPARTIEEKIVLLGRNATPVAGSNRKNYQSYHGGGLYPAPLWPIGHIIPEQIAIPLTDTMTTPTQVTVNVSLVGEERSVDAGTFKVIPTQFPPLSDTPIAQLGDHIQVVTATLSTNTAHAGDTLTAHITWQVTAPLSQDWTTFLHLGDPTQPPLAQGDRPPLNGDYPTRFWDTGEVITDTYTLTLPVDLPAGIYPIWLGMYDPDNFIRLPVTIAGNPQPYNALQIDLLTIR